MFFTKHSCFSIARFSAIAIVAWGGCSSISKPGPVISDSLYVEVLVDLHLLQARFDEGVPIDSTLRQSALVAHGISEEDLALTSVFYADHQEEFLALYSRVIDRIAEERQKIE